MFKSTEWYTNAHIFVHVGLSPAQFIVADRVSECFSALLQLLKLQTLTQIGQLRCHPQLKVSLDHVS